MERSTGKEEERERKQRESRRGERGEGEIGMRESRGRGRRKRE